MLGTQNSYELNIGINHIAFRLFVDFTERTSWRFLPVYDWARANTFGQGRRPEGTPRDDSWHYESRETTH